MILDNFIFQLFNFVVQETVPQAQGFPLVPSFFSLPSFPLYVLHNFIDILIHIQHYTKWFHLETIVQPIGVTMNFTSRRNT